MYRKTFANVDNAKARSESIENRSDKSRHSSNGGRARSGALIGAHSKSINASWSKFHP
jgi:hypothetical protein